MRLGIPLALCILLAPDISRAEQTRLDVNDFPDRVNPENVTEKLPRAEGTHRFAVNPAVLGSLFRSYRPAPSTVGGLLLSGQRVQVSIAYSNQHVTPPATGQATGILQGDEFGFWYFFRPDNPEVFVKVLDFSSLGGKFYVFFAALSDLQYTVTAKVLCTGQTITRTVAAGHPQVVIDFTLLVPPLASCPSHPQLVAGVTSLNGLTGALTLAAGSNVTITPSASTLTIASSGGGLTLPYSGSVSTSSPAMSLQNTAGPLAHFADGTVAVYGQAGPVGGIGVQGLSDVGQGVEGRSASGEGVLAFSLSGRGLLATTNTGPYGVYAAALGGGIGVRGDTSSGHAGVYGSAWGTSVFTAGVAGVWGDSGSFTGVYGTSNTDVGVRGASAANYGVYAQGGIAGTGPKYFVEPHPTDASKEIRYVALEGPESGTYFRGTGRTVGGVATIAVPESFRMVTDAQGLTVILTPIGRLATIACVRKSLRGIQVQSSEDVEFDYLVQGVRRAYKDLQPIVENQDFVPRSADDRSFLIGLSQEAIRRLKANGTLHEDGSIRLDTAERLGWTERWVEPGRPTPQP